MPCRPCFMSACAHKLRRFDFYTSGGALPADAESGGFKLRRVTVFDGAGSSPLWRDGLFFVIKITEYKNARAADDARRNAAGSACGIRGHTPSSE